MKYAICALLLLTGCSVIDTGSHENKNNNANQCNVTFVYTYANNGKPIAGARVANNVKVDVIVKDQESQQDLRTQIDAGGWILVRPESPIKVESPQK